MSNLLSNLSIPFKAILSIRFYIDVMFKWRGAGLSYLFMLNAVLALLACYPVMRTLDNFRQIELSQVVAQIPASYVDKTGVLHPKQPTGQPLSLKNSKGQVVVVYNPYDVADPQGDYPIVHISANAVVINTTKGLMTLPWSAVYGEDGGDFEPLPVSQMMEETFNSGLVSCWIMVVVWLFLSNAMIVLFAAIIGKILALLIFKIRYTLLPALRISAVGSTMVAFLMVAQFYIYLPVSYLALTSIPVVYMLSFARFIRNITNRAQEDPAFAASDANPLREWIKFDASWQSLNPSAGNPWQPRSDQSQSQATNQTQQSPFEQQPQSEKQGKTKQPTWTQEQPQSDSMQSQPNQEPGAKPTLDPEPQSLEEQSLFESDAENPKARSGEVKSGSAGQDSSFTP